MYRNDIECELFDKKDKESIGTPTTSITSKWAIEEQQACQNNGVTGLPLKSSGTKEGSVQLIVCLPFMKFTSLSQPPGYCVCRRSGD